MKMKATTSSSVEFDRAVNIARQALYRFVGLSLADPRYGSWERLSVLRDDAVLFEAAALIRHLRQARPATLSNGERPFTDLDPQPVFDRLPGSRHALNTQFETAFGLLVSGDCPPYETEYINSKFAFQRSNALADISGFYSAFGLAIAEAHPERPDHIILELEFMASLLELERRAADDNSELRQQRLQTCREAQARFMNEHLAWWAPAFAKLLAQQNRGGFYEAVGVFLAALIPTERSLLKIDVTTRHVLPSLEEHPEVCEGCQLTN
jgi:TorA maturation chaperone TorD